jgi:hypothetical protein
MRGILENRNSGLRKISISLTRRAERGEFDNEKG